MGDRRFEQLRPGQPAIALVHRPPRIDRPRYRHGHRAQRRQRTAPRPRPHRLQAEPPRRRARSRQPDDLALLRIPDHRIAIAANAAGGRLQKPETGIDRDGDIHRRPALPQDVDAGLGRQWMGRTRSAVEPICRRAGREARPDRPIARGDVGAQKAIGTRLPTFRERWHHRLRRAALPRTWHALPTGYTRIRLLWFCDNRTGQKRRPRHGGKKSSTTHDGYSAVLVRILTNVPDKYKVYRRVSGLPFV
ncbi:hypothetical protein JAGODDHD_02234 [Sphingomonas paucimobilis]|nr:hypothetical protein [Sphingomonas paucimobilis]SUJ12978.1 Uncharacterised protein [Sphingomonas paucimobilis]